ncbi:hypothetical protein [Salinirussus salinus]|uniref:hypothetical protein n=1 Tax=Salinirussus salinus TaxID=1198300 RepID=UPI001358858E|nr:hypothetical protein [Salinirussus salinus]
MDRLSSCYFCGTALDEPLQDYSLVAGDTGEHGAVVTLCPGCHHKLETVLDVVVGEDEILPALEDTDRAALEGESPAALTEPETESGPDPIALGDGEQSDSEERDGASDAGSVGGAGEGGEGDTGGAAPTDAETEAGDGAEPDVEPPAVDSADAESGRDADGPDDETAGDSRDAGADPPDADGDTSDADRGAADDGSDGAGGTGSPSPADGRNTGTDSTATEAATAGDTADERGGTDPDREVTATVSALEYNKVMRLLQNREFPVDRAEIETVAASAYELSESECAAVIDLAVDRGLIAERDGQLVRPDG